MNGLVIERKCDEIGRRKNVKEEEVCCFNISRDIVKISFV